MPGRPEKKEERDWSISGMSAISDADLQAPPGRSH
jgi:hypothetical protein